MVSFRFFLISIVAVFLAMAVGIALGSGFLSDVIIGQIDLQIRNVREDNERLEAENSEQAAQLERNEAFIQSVKPRLMDGALEDERVVIVTFDRTEDTVLDSVRTAIEEADGDVVSTLRFTEKLSLASDAEVDELSLLVGSTAGTPEEVRIDLADRVGNALAAASAVPSGAGEAGEAARSTQRLVALLRSLEDAGYLTIESAEPDVVVPSSAHFLVVGGGSERAPFELGEFVVALVERATSRGAVAVVAERSDTEWELVAAVRAEIPNIASTVDHVGSPSGEIAVALALDRTIQGVVGHYGYEDGATEPIPPDITED